MAAVAETPYEDLDSCLDGESAESGDCSLTIRHDVAAALPPTRSPAPSAEPPSPEVPKPPPPTEATPPAPEPPDQPAAPPDEAKPAAEPKQP
jgi:hypothetical protein